MPSEGDYDRADHAVELEATIAPTAMITSGSLSTIAAGPVPSRSDSARTLDEELDPRPEGIKTTRPVTDSPCWGWAGR